MRFFFVPLSIIFMYIISFFGLQFSWIGTYYFFRENWLLIILGFSLIMGTLFWFTIMLPNLIKLYVFNFFKNNRIVIFIHQLVILCSVIHVTYCLFYFPPIVITNSDLHFISYSWSINPLKTILMLCVDSSILLSIVYTTILFSFNTEEI